MSLLINPAPSREIPLVNSDPVQQDSQRATLFNTVGKTTKLIMAVLSALAASGLFSVAIAFTPFFPQAGVGALALSTALFTLAGSLFYNNASAQGASPSA